MPRKHPPLPKSNAIDAQRRANQRAFEERCAMVPSWWDSLMEVYAATEYPPVGREGAFPFLLHERVAVTRPDMADHYLALWNEYMLLGEDDGPKALELEKRLVNGHKIMLDMIKTT